MIASLLFNRLASVDSYAVKNCRLLWKKKQFAMVAISFMLVFCCWLYFLKKIQQGIEKTGFFNTCLFWVIV